MALRRLDKKPLTTLGHKTGGSRKPLTFLKPVPDPLRGLKPTDSNEKNIANEVKATKSAIGERLKADAKRRKIATAADDYFVVCFEGGAQATAFPRFAVR